MRKQEARFEKEKEKAKQKRVEKQLGEHNMKMPKVKESMPEGTPIEPKRKRVNEDVQMTESAKVPKTSTSGNTNGAVRSGPPQRPGSGMGGGPMVKKKKYDANDVFMKRR